MEQNIDNNEIYSNNNIGNINEYKNVPVVALRDVVVFPGTTVYFEVGREATVKAVNEAMHGKQYIFAVAQKDPKVEHPKQNDLFEIGTLAQVKQLVTMPGNVVRVIIVGQEKMKLGSLVLEDGYYKADLEKVEESRQISYDIETIALIRGLKDLFSVYVNERGRINKNVVDEIMDCTDLDSLINQIATGMQVNYQFKQKILAETETKENASGGDAAEAVACEPSEGSASSADDEAFINEEIAVSALSGACCPSDIEKAAVAEPVEDRATEETGAAPFEAVSETSQIAEAFELGRTIQPSEAEVQIEAAEQELAQTVARMSEEERATFEKETLGLTSEEKLAYRKLSRAKRRVLKKIAETRRRKMQIRLENERRAAAAMEKEEKLRRAASEYKNYTPDGDDGEED